MAFEGRVTHVGVCVADVDRAADFWTALGFRRATGMPEGHYEGAITERLLSLEGASLDNVFLERDGFCIELLCFRAPPTPAEPPARQMNHLGFTHLSIRVPDIDRAVDAIEAAGARAERATLVEVGGIKVAIFVRDPDGLPIELVRG
jgi:glyoxylase I family protein